MVLMMTPPRKILNDVEKTATATATTTATRQKTTIQVKRQSLPPIPAELLEDMWGLKML